MWRLCKFFKRKNNVSLLIRNLAFLFIFRKKDIFYIFNANPYIHYTSAWHSKYDIYIVSWFIENWSLSPAEIFFFNVETLAIRWVQANRYNNTYLMTFFSSISKKPIFILILFTQKGKKSIYSIDSKQIFQIVLQFYQ